MTKASRFDYAILVRCLGTAVLLASLPVLAASGQAVPVYSEASALRYQILRVAVDAGRPPYQFIADGRLTGFNVEAIIRIGEALGIGMALQAMPATAGLQALAEGRVDLVLGRAYSPEAAAFLDFSEPLASSSIAVLVAAGDERFRDGLTDLGSGVVALTRDSPAYDFLKNIRTIRFNETTVPADAFSLLASGRADAFLEDRLTARYFIRAARCRWNTPWLWPRATHTLFIC